MARISACVRTNQLTMAEVLFSLAYNDYKGIVCFLEIGVSLFLKTHKVQRAVELQREALGAAPPSLKSCQTYFECLCDLPQSEGIDKVAGLLTQVAQLFEHTELESCTRKRAEAFGFALQDEPFLEQKEKISGA